MPKEVAVQYFIYVRKSTDVETKQVLSVEAQLVGAKREYAAKYGLQIADTFYRKRTAKSQGRPVV